MASGSAYARIAGLCLAFALPAAALAEPEATAREARGWLEKTVGGARGLNFEGVFVYAQGGRLEAMRVVHGQGADGDWQRLVALSGPPREVLVANHDVSGTMAQGQVALRAGRIASSFPVALPRDLATLEVHYRFVPLGEDRVAGRAARVVGVEPRDRLRFGYRLWLDRDCGLVLRSALLDEDGHTLEQLMFTSLELLEAPPPEPGAGELQAAQAAGKVLQPERAEPSRWRVGQLPAGFEPVRYSRFGRHSDGRETDHIVYSDGLATISVFVEKLDGGAPLLEGYSRIGPMSAYGLVHGEYQVVVIGEVPRAAVEMAARSLEPAAETKR